MAGRAVLRLAVDLDRGGIHPEADVFGQGTTRVESTALRNRVRRGHLAPDARLLEPAAVQSRAPQAASVRDTSGPTKSHRFAGGLRFSGGGGSRTHEGPEGPERFSRPPRSTTPAPLQGRAPKPSVRSQPESMPMVLLAGSLNDAARS